jgi:hypothetical protein
VLALCGGAGGRVRAIDVLLPGGGAPVPSFLQAAPPLGGAPAAGAGAPPLTGGAGVLGFLLALRGPLIALAVFAFVFFSGAGRRKGGWCARREGAEGAGRGFALGGTGEAGAGSRGRGGLAPRRGGHRAAPSSIEAELEQLLQQVGRVKGGGGGVGVGELLGGLGGGGAAPGASAEEKRLLRRAREAATAPDAADEGGAEDEATAANRVAPMTSSDEE